MRWGDTSLCRGGGGQTGPGHPLVQGAGPVQLTSQKSTDEKKRFISIDSSHMLSE